MSANPPPLPKSVGGFTPIPIAYSPTATHILYARAHSNPKSTKPSAKQNDKGKEKEAVYPEGRTLFLVNLPPDATERELTLFFKAAGTVERVVFDADREALAGEDDLGDVSDSEEEDEEGDREGAEEAADAPAERPRKKRKTGKQDAPPEATPLPAPALRTLRRTGRSAHLVFLDASSLSRALSLAASTSSTPKSTSKPRPWPTDDSAPLGLAHYLAAHTAARAPLDAVRAHADTYMARFEWAQARARRASKYRMGEAVVDEDGFTLVTRGGAYGKTLGGGVAVASKQFQAETGGGKTGAGGKRHRKKKPETKEKEGFYAFQAHERKRKELMDLKSKWEEDKAKVEKLKQSRRFKPY